MASRSPKYRLLSLLCCMVKQPAPQTVREAKRPQTRMTTELRSLKELCEPVLIRWINLCLDYRHGEKITCLEDFGEGIRFATFVEGVTKVTVETFTSYTTWSQHQHDMVEMTFMLLRKLSLVEDGEYSVDDIIQGDAEKIRQVALKLLEWFMSSYYNANYARYRNITLGAQERRDERRSAATDLQVISDEKTSLEIAKPLALKLL